MNAAHAVVAAAVGLCVLDFALAILFGRCVIPGLKCAACRERGPTS